MKKILALVLALLLIVPTVLTACTTTVKETESETKTETSTKVPDESGSESGSESGTVKETDSGNESDTPKETNSEQSSESESELPEMPTFKNGKVLKLRLTVPMESPFDDGKEEPAEPIEKYADTTAEKIPGVWFDIEYNLETGVLNVYCATDYKEDPDDEDYFATVYFDGEYLYTNVSSGSAEKTEKNVVSVDAVVRNLLAKAGMEEDDFATELLVGVIKNLLKGGFGDLGDTAADASLLMKLLPANIRNAIEKIAALLPEVKEPEEPAEPEVPAEDPTAEIFYTFFEKVDGEDGIVYTFDFTKVTVPFAALLGTMQDVINSTPAQLIDILAGEGKFDTYFTLITGSVKGDTELGSFIDMVVMLLNAKGFRITDEKIVDAIVAVSKVAGEGMTEEEATAMYEGIRKLTLDELLAKIPGSDTPITVAYITEQIKTFMTTTKISDLVNMIFNDPDASAAICETLGKVKDFVEKITGKVDLLADANNEIYEIDLVFDYAGTNVVDFKLNVNDKEELDVPEIPDMSGIKEEKNANGDLVFSGLPEGAKVRVELRGYISTLFDLNNLYVEWDETDEAKYVKVDGSTVTILAIDKAEYAFAKWKEWKEESTPTGKTDVPASETPYKGVFNDSEDVYTFTYNFRVTLELADGTQCILYPFEEMGSVSFLDLVKAELAD